MASEPQLAEPSSSSDPREEFVKNLHAAHGAALFGFAVGELRGDRQAAEDIVQETLLRAWQHADRAASVTSPRAWLFTIAHRLVIDRWRTMSARPVEVPDDQLSTIGVHDNVERSLSRMVIRDALAGLAGKYRAVLVELYFRGRSVAETADVLGIPVGTVKSRAHHALHALRAALEAKGADSHG